MPETPRQSAQIPPCEPLPLSGRKRDELSVTAANSVSFLLRGNPPELPRTIPKKEIPRKQNQNGKCEEGEGGYGTAEAERHCFRSVSERTLGRDGIRFRPDTCPETSGQNTKKKNVLSISKENHPRENTKKQGTFFFLVLPSVARRWRGVRRAYDLISHHTARGACALPTLLFISQILKIGSNLVQ